MYAIRTTILEKNLKKTLTYFSSEKYEVGSLVKIKIRNKTTTGLVTEVKNILDEKSSIKKMDFSLKKVNSGNANQFLTTHFIAATKKIANYFACTQGAVLKQLIPNIVLEQQSLQMQAPIPIDKNQNSKEEKHFVSVIQMNSTERYDHYKSMIRSKFAQKKSVFICISRNEEALRLQEILGKGIEEYIATPNSNLGIKKLKSELAKITNKKHPILIIATSSWLFIPRNDYGVFIIEGENTNGWKTLNSPYLDMRKVTEIISSEYNTPCVYGDSCLRIETLYRYKSQEYSEFGAVKWRLTPEVNTQIGDKSAEIKNTKEPKIISTETINQIEQFLKKKKNVFIYSPRKGLASVILCKDCGQTVECNNCGSPMVLYKGEQENFFRCHQCSERRTSKELCKKCGGWHLLSMGGGIDKVTTELEKNLQGIEILEINKDKTGTQNAVKSVIKKFYQNKGTVLVATEMALPYMAKKIPLVVATSFSPLFSVPDYKINEKIFRLIIELRDTAKELFILETNGSNLEIEKLAANGDILSFYYSEIEDRKILNYPPFSIFIKITVRGKKDVVSEEIAKTIPLFEEYEHTTFTSIHEKRGEQSAQNIIIKIPTESWPIDDIVQKLITLPPYFEIKIMPDNLL